ncbi:uncharacterized protein LOC119165775 isoform X1 [Rhipicephalus microplus]|uniref:uncharacterized protein LOC119165775 isoform X1 n=1 Tax=Rhipicephalus microplus TaxID=6941 RepID=UPI003F6B3852
MNPAVLLFCIAYIASTHAFNHNGQYSQWLQEKDEQGGEHPQYSDYEWSLPEIGQGVSVTAKVFYDSTLKSTASSQNEVTEDENEPTLEDFKKLFKEVEDFFHTLSIMIKIEVVSVHQIDSLGVENKPGSLEANVTLEKLKSHVATEQDGNNTINYLFTRKPLFVKATGEEPNDHYTYYGTFKTFCSILKSAVIVHHQSMNDPTNAIGGTAWMFGLTGYDSVEMDFFTMLWVFQRCPKSNCPAHCTTQCPAK